MVEHRHDRAHLHAVEEAEDGLPTLGHPGGGHRAGSTTAASGGLVGKAIEAATESRSTHPQCIVEVRSSVLLFLNASRISPKKQECQDEGLNHFHRKMKVFRGSEKQEERK